MNRVFLAVIVLSLSSESIALDCWGYMNKPKAEREACMAEANKRMATQPTQQERNVEERNRRDASNRLAEQQEYLAERERLRARAAEREQQRQQAIARQQFEDMQRERLIRAQEAAAAAAQAQADAMRREQESPPRPLKCFQHGPFIDCK